MGEEDNTKESVFTLSITSSHKPIVPHPLKSTENITKTIEIKTKRKTKAIQKVSVKLKANLGNPTTTNQSSNKPKQKSAHPNC